MSAATSSVAPIHGLHHFAWRCRDAEETRHFYEDLLGLPLAHVIKADTVPSTGEYCPYVHVFFQMRDGSYIAFFDLGDNEAADAEAHQHQRHAARLEQAVDTLGGGGGPLLKDLVDRGPERDQRGRRADPRHQRAIESQQRTHDREVGALVGECRALDRELVRGFRRSLR